MRKGINKKDLKGLLKRPPDKTKEERLTEALAFFAMDLHMAINAFQQRVEIVRTGYEIVAGNDGVVLGKRKVR